MGPEELKDPEKIRQEIERLWAETHKLGSKLGDKLADTISEDLATEKIGVYINSYISEVTSLTDSNQYTRELDDQAFAKIFAEFHKENEAIFPTLAEGRQKQVQNAFDQFLAPLRDNLRRIQDLKRQEAELKAQAALKEKLAEARIAEEELQKEEQRLTEEEQKEKERSQEKIKELKEKKRKLEGEIREKRGELKEGAGKLGANIDYPDLETFEFASCFSLVSRLAKIHGCDVEAKEGVDKTELAKSRVQNVKEVLTRALSEIRKSIESQDHHCLVESKDETQVKLYAAVRERLEGRLAIPVELDFTSGEKLQVGIYFSLVSMLGVSVKDINSDEQGIVLLKKEIQKKLQEAGIEEDKATAFMESLRAFIQMRMELNLIGEVKLDELTEGKLASCLKELEEREEVFRKSVGTGVCRDPSKPAFLGGKPIGEMVREGLYEQFHKDGSVSYVITKYDEETLAEVVNRLKHKDVISWRNMPSKFRQAAEFECLRNWKRAEFDGKETDLSLLRPPQPGSWAQWLMNINGRDDHRWMYVRNSKLKENLIQKVVGDDEKRLNEFWKDLVRTGSDELIADAYKYLTETQKVTLAGSFGAQMDLLRKKEAELSAREPQDDVTKIEMVRCKIQLSEIEKASETFSAFGKPAQPVPTVVKEEKEEEEESKDTTMSM